FYVKASTVDYADIFQEKLDARKMAYDGRKQELGDLTSDGRPDTSAPLVALLLGGEKGASLAAATTTMEPFFITQRRSGQALRCSLPKAAPKSAPWGVVEQAGVKPTFESAAMEAIPFLP